MYRRAAQDIVIFCASIGVVKVVAPKRAGVAATFSDGWDVQNDWSIILPILVLKASPCFNGTPGGLSRSGSMEGHWLEGAVKRAF